MIKNNKKYFDPYTFDYKNYMKETYNLTEIPNKLPPLTLSVDYTDNTYQGMQVEKNGELIGRFKFGNENLRIFKETTDGKIWISLLSSDSPLIAAEHVYQRVDKPISGIVNLHIWHYKYYKGLMWKWFREMVIPQEYIIISDKNQTELGFKFWKNLLDEYVIEQKTHGMYVIDFKSGKKVKNIIDKKEMDLYYQQQNTSQFRFVLEKL